MFRGCSTLEQHCKLTEKKTKKESKYPDKLYTPNNHPWAPSNTTLRLGKTYF